jgi:hypothetical protein
MTTTLFTAPVAPVAATTLADWVEVHTEVCRGGRIDRLLVNHRDRVAFRPQPGELAEFEALAADQPGESGLRTELREQGFLADSPPTQRARQSFLRTLDVHWSGADRLVQWAYARGARHAFHPIAIAAQIVLAIAGLAALVHAIAAGAEFQLQVQPAQIPIIIGLGLVAVAVHEFSHALVVAHNGRHIDSFGFRLHLGTPAFYVESVDALLLPRRQRIVQAAAGPWAEWLVTCVVALWLWWAPLVVLAPLLYRFIVLNSITVLTNLAPFVGLDGHWLLADGLREPDLAQRTQGSVGRLVLDLVAHRPVRRESWALAAYAIANAVVAGFLLLTSVFFWYALFGGLIASALAAGPFGWLALAVAALLLLRPAAVVALPRIIAGATTVRSFARQLRFRFEWRWRIPATEALAASVPSFAGLTEYDLGVLAGQLRRGPGEISVALNRRCRRSAIVVSLDPSFVVSVGPSRTE